MSKLIGQSLRRREDHALLAGRGQYAGDITLPGLLHMAVVRSVHPHARLEQVDLTAARALPGVVGAFALPDLPEIGGPMGDPVPQGLEGRSRPVLAHEKVRYVGEPIAVVVAEDPAQAADGAEAVEVEYAPIEGVGNVEAALQPGAPTLSLPRRPTQR